MFIFIFKIKGLSQAEEMLISTVMPLMSIYRLPHGQYGYKGHVINLPQDVTSFASSLPRNTKNLDVLIVRKHGSDNTHKDFRVRRSVVLHALLWLKQHNKYYRDVTIDMEEVKQLPIDGNLSNITTIEDASIKIEDKSQQQEENDESYQELGSFVPITVQKGTEEETVKKSINERQKPHPDNIIPWPSRGDTPINEFVTEGYISCAFPTLFPTGNGDFLAPRQRTVTVGNYFKHLMRYEDGRFAKHPRFRYFALNTEMRWRALQTGNIYINQHPKDARLSLEDLKEMISSGGKELSKRVLHYATSLRGTKQFWFKQRSRLISMIDCLGMPTVFFTHSAADNQWPELARLIAENPDESSSRSSAVNNNPAIADWFFYERISKFMKTFYVDVLGATDYWFRFEWQHRGSPHVHGVAWLHNAPDIEKLLSSDDSAELLDAAERITAYVDGLVSTMNPGIPADGNNIINSIPLPKIKPHVCNQQYQGINNLEMDLVDLVATCQRHTRCSTSYCLKRKRGKQECRFGYPKPLQQVTTITTQEGEPVVLTSRNDNLLNAYNPVQLSAWRANVDMQYIVSRNKVIKYVAKYATKSEPRSKGLQEVYSTIMKSIKEDATPLKVVQKLLTSTIGERDFSAQETCHLLLMLPLFRASRDFVVLSLDGSRQVTETFEEDKSVTVDSQLDHYCARPDVPEFREVSLLKFVQKYRIPKKIGSALVPRNKDVIVIPRPYCSPDPQGPQYEQYSKQKLMLHKPFVQLDELLGGCDTYAAAYATFLQSGNVPKSLADDIHRLEMAQAEDQQTVDEEVTIIYIVKQFIFYSFICILFAGM